MKKHSPAKRNGPHLVPSEKTIAQQKEMDPIWRQIKKHSPTKKKMDPIWRPTKKHNPVKRNGPIWGQMKKT